MATTSGSETDLDTGFGVLFGLLSAAMAGVVLYAQGLTRGVGFGAAIVFAMLLVASLHVYR
ncbi:MAG: hypothetical protein ABEJ44_04355 [Halanaeroarchaeum sp.]